MDNSPVIDGLKAKLAELSSTIRTLQARARSLEHQKATVLAALRLFDTTDSERPTLALLGFKTGTFSRMVLDVLRKSEAPLSPRQIAEALSGDREPLDKAEMDVLLTRVRNALHRMSAQVEGEARGTATYWRVRG